METFKTKQRKKNIVLKLIYQLCKAMEVILFSNLHKQNVRQKINSIAQLYETLESFLFLIF